MTQKQQVIEAMRNNGGYATLKQLKNLMDFSTWKTKTPLASVSNIVQVNNEFFKIRPGLWALTDLKEEVLSKLDLQENNKNSNENFTHSYYQGLIVEIGNMRGLRTYVPKQDRNKLFLEKRLSETATLEELPPFPNDRIASRAKTVDVIWFNERDMPCRFYEVEHTTNISNSLDKFYELQDFRANYYIVADESRRNQYNSLMERSIYEKIKKYVKFFSYDALVHQYEDECSLASRERI